MKCRSSDASTLATFEVLCTNLVIAVLGNVYVSLCTLYSFIVAEATGRVARSLHQSKIPFSLCNSSDTSEKFQYFNALANVWLVFGYENFSFTV